MFGRRREEIIVEPRREGRFGVFGERHPGREAIKVREGAEFAGFVIGLGTAAVGGIAHLFGSHDSTEVPEWKKKKMDK